MSLCNHEMAFVLHPKGTWEMAQQTIRKFKALKLLFLIQIIGNLYLLTHLWQQSAWLGQQSIPGVSACLCCPILAHK